MTERDNMASARNEKGTVYFHVGEEVDENPEWASLDRERGVLTPDDRNYLIGEKELSDQAERNTRFRIRKRLKNSLFDFNILYDYLPSEDRKQVFEEVFDADPEQGGPTLPAIVGLLYLGLLDTHESPDEAENQLAMALGSSIRDIEKYQNEIFAEVSFNIRRREPDLKELRNKIIGGNATLDELSYYLTLGDGEKLAEEMPGDKVEVNMGSQSITMDFRFSEGEDEETNAPEEG